MQDIISKLTDNVNELTVAVVALIFSIPSFVLSYLQAKKLNKTNLISEFYTEIYKDTLITKIPEAFEELNIDYSNKRLIHCQNLNDVLDDLKDDSAFFEHVNIRLYKKVCNKVDEIQSITVAHASFSPNRQIKDVEKAKKDIKRKITKIYKLLIKYYTK